MSLQTVAAELAASMNAEVEPGENEHAITVRGKGYHFVVSTFFGGWQVTLHIPNRPPVTYYGESAQMLELRMKAKLTGRDDQF